MSEKPKLPVGVSVLLVRKFTRQYDILLGIRQNTSAEGFWSTPGGRVEENENIFQAAVREVKEECGVDIYVDDLRLIAVHELFRYNQHYIMFYILATRYVGGIKNLITKQCKEWVWFNVENIPSNCTEPDPVIAHLNYALNDDEFGGTVDEVVICDKTSSNSNKSVEHAKVGKK